jgi:hypothetical protein
MTVTTSCSYSGGPYQWSAIDLAVADRRLVGYGATKEEAVTDLKRLLGEKAEVTELAKEGGWVIQRASPLSLDEQLEPIIDRYGLDNVLDMIGLICGQKAKHIAENWQNTALAKRWAGLEVVIGAIVPSAKGL